MKEILKIGLYLVCTVLVSPLIVICNFSKSGSLFAALAQFLSLVPGKIGSYTRISFYSMTIQKCPREGFIGFGTYLTNPEVEIGNGVYIGSFSIIGIASIGDNATIASHVSILSGKHQHGYKEIGKPIQKQDGNFVKIYIGENCWIGSGAIIMANLGVQNIVSAGAVITSDTGDYEVWRGNPANLVEKLI